MGVQRAAGPDDEQNGDMATDADQVHNQEGHESQHLNLRESGEGAEVEVNHHPSLVRILHVVHALGLLMVQAMPLRIAKRQDTGFLLVHALGLLMVQALPEDSQTSGHRIPAG